MDIGEFILYTMTSRNTLDIEKHRKHVCFACVVRRFCPEQASKTCQSALKHFWIQDSRFEIRRTLVLESRIHELPDLDESALKCFGYPVLDSRFKI